MISNSVRLPRLSRLQRIVVLLLAVTGVLVGLLAMHTLTDVSGDHTTHHAVALFQDDSMVDSGAGAVAHSADMRTSETGVSQVTTTAGDADEPGPGMADMACLLALLALTLILTLRVIFSRRGNNLHRLLGAMTTVPPAALALPPPPSLHVLSISRT